MHLEYSKKLEHCANQKECPFNYCREHFNSYICRCPIAYFNNGDCADS